MSNQFNIDRQLALRIVTGDFNAQQSAVAELRALLAAPVVERQPIAHRIEFTDGHKSKWIDGAPASIDIDDAREGVIAGVELAFASPPAPVAVALPDRAAFEAWRDSRNASIAEHGGSASWYVTQAHYATWEACLDKVKEMN